MSEVEILKWAAGSRGTLPEIESVDADLLLEASYRHRLAGYFLRRLSSEGVEPPWLTEFIVSGLREQQQNALDVTRSQIDVMKEVTEIYSSRKGRNVIPLKGFSAYVLTGDPATMRASVDIDVMSDDLELLKEVFLEVGYHIYRENEGYNYAKLIGPHFVEIHSYYPIFRFSGLLDLDSMDPELHDGEWRQDITAVCDRVPYDVIAEYMTTTELGDFGKCIVTDPTMTVFIRCLHTLKSCNYLFPNKSGVLGLSDLSEILELVRHPNFDFDRLRHLAYTLNATYHLDFTGMLMQSILGTNPLPVTREWKGKELGRLLIHRYFAYWLPHLSSVDDLIVGSEAPEQILKHLGVSRIIAGNGEVAIRYTALRPDSGREVDRVLTQTPEGKHLQLTFSVDWKPDGLEFFVSVFVTRDEFGSENPCDQVCFDFGGMGCTWSYERNEDTGRILDVPGAGEVIGAVGIEPSEYHVSFSEVGYDLRIRFNWKELDGVVRHDGRVYLALSAMRWANRKTQMAAMTIIPLEIVQA